MQQLLLACIHFTGGLPGRGTETTMLRWCNTRHVMRNIFAYQGRLVIITEYTKARARTNKSFYIVRFLPLLVSQILFQYLAYIRPFITALNNEAQHGFRTSILLDQHSLAFTSEGHMPLNTGQLSGIISQQTQRLLNVSLTTASYLQASVAIAKRHIAAIAKPFDQYSAKNSASNAQLLGIARQAGHTIQTLMDSYAIDKAYPTRLQPELIQQYKMVSEQWHHWLRIGDLERKLDDTARQLQNRCTTLGKATRRTQPLQQQQVIQPPKQPPKWPPSGHAQVQQESTQTLKHTLDSSAQTSPNKRQARAKSPTVLLCTPPPTSLATIYAVRTTVNLSLPAIPRTQDWSASPTALDVHAPVYAKARDTYSKVDLSKSSSCTRPLLTPLKSTNLNQGLHELQRLLETNPWQ